MNVSSELRFTAYHRSIVGAVDGDGDGGGGAVCGSNGEGIADGLTDIEFIEGLISCVGPDAILIDGEGTVFALDISLNLEGVVVINIAGVQCAVDGDGRVGFISRS